MEQLLAHLVGDYVLQSHWMATEKTKRWLPCAVHVALYTLCFLLLTQSIPALAMIAGTHYLIDRYRLARYLVWWKNKLHPSDYSVGQHWNDRGVHPTTATGFPPTTPDWMAVWLLIITDNTLHLVINYFAIKLL